MNGIRFRLSVFLLCVGFLAFPESDTLSLWFDATLNGKPLGSVAAFLDEEGRLLGLGRDSLVPILAPYVEEPLPLSDGAGEILSLDELRSLSMDVRLDPDSLVAHIEIPPEFMKLVTVSAFRVSPVVDVSPIGPAPFSFAANVWTSQAWRKNADDGEPFRYASFSTDSWANAGGWAVNLRTSRDSAGNAEELDVTLSRDFPGNPLRMEAGALDVSVQGFQTGGKWTGFGLYRLERARVRFGGSEEFTLAEASTVTVKVNGKPLRTLSLDAGRYLLSDLPFYDGINGLELGITGSGSGASRFITRYIPTDALLLGPGNIDFSAVAGCIDRDLDLPIYDAWFRIGLLDFADFGINARMERDSSLSGIQLRTASPWGNLAFDGGLRYGREGVPPSAAVSGVWTFASNVNARLPRIRFGGGMYGENFDGTGDGRLAEAYLSATKTAESGITFRAGGNWSAWRGGAAPSLWVEQGADWYVKRNLLLSLSVREAPIRSSDESWSVSFSALYRSGSGHIYGARTSTGTGMTTLDWQRSLPEHGVSASASASTYGKPMPGGSGYSLLASLRASRPYAEGGLAVNLDDSAGAVSYAARLDAGTALVGVWPPPTGRFPVFGISRPVSEAFALVVPRPELAPVRLGVNAGPYGYERVSGRFGAAALPGLVPYAPKSVRVDLLDAPPEAWLREDTWTVMPHFRSGALVVVGDTPTIDAVLFCRDEYGAPIPLVAGTWNQKEESGVFFTEENGSCVISGLDAGEATLVLPGYTPLTVAVGESVAPEFLIFTAKDGSSHAP